MTIMKISVMPYGHLYTIPSINCNIERVGWADMLAFRLPDEKLPRLIVNPDHVIAIYTEEAEEGIGNDR